MKRSLARVMVVMILGSIVLSGCTDEGESSAACNRGCLEDKERRGITDEQLAAKGQYMASGGIIRTIKDYTPPETKLSATDAMSVEGQADMGEGGHDEGEHDDGGHDEDP